MKKTIKILCLLVLVMLFAGCEKNTTFEQKNTEKDDSEVLEEYEQELKNYCTLQSAFPIADMLGNITFAADIIDSYKGLLIGDSIVINDIYYIQEQKYITCFSYPYYLRLKITDEQYAYIKKMYTESESCPDFFCTFTIDTVVPDKTSWYVDINLDVDLTIGENNKITANDSFIDDADAQANEGIIYGTLKNVTKR